MRRNPDLAGRIDFEQNFVDERTQVAESHGTAVARLHRRARGSRRGHRRHRAASPADGAASLLGSPRGADFVSQLHSGESIAVRDCRARRR